VVQNSSGIALLRQLRALLHQREHEAFLTAFRSPPLQALAKVDDYVKALGGEGLCLLLESDEQHPKPLLRAYETFLLAGTLLAPHNVILELAARLKSKTLQLLGERNRLLENRLSRAQGRQPSPRARNQDLVGPVIEVRRFVQSTFMEFGPLSAAETAGRRRSVFRSEQERTFLQALTLRFPAFMALPNYPLDQVADVSNMRHLLGEKVWTYGRQCRLDAVLVVPGDGRPVAAFELDSAYHDDPKVQVRDEMKNAIFRLLGMPFFRLRVESPGSMRSDEWYALLTEEVVPHLNPGQPLRSTVF